MNTFLWSAPVSLSGQGVYGLYISHDQGHRPPSRSTTFPPPLIQQHRPSPPSYTHLWLHLQYEQRTPIADQRANHEARNCQQSRRVRNKKACCRTAIDHLLQPSHLEESPNLILLLLQHSPQGFKLEILADVPRRCLDTSERLDLYQCRRSWTSGNTSSLPLDTVGTRSAPRS